jgi:hypothetical protein
LKTGPAYDGRPGRPLLRGQAVDAGKLAHPEAHPPLAVQGDGVTLLYTSLHRVIYEFSIPNSLKHGEESKGLRKC